jgi:hypothetical protein
MKIPTSERNGELMGSYINADGSSVQFTDDELQRQATVLYSILKEEAPSGSSNMENDVVRQLLTDLWQNKPLNNAQHGALAQLLRKYAPQIAAAQKSEDYDGQDYLHTPPEGQGRVTPAPVALKEAEGKQPSLAPQDVVRSPPHLLDTVLHDLAHAAQHGKQLADAEVQNDPQSLQFNQEHMIKHLQGAQSHAQKLDAHLSKFKSDPKVWAVERDALNGQRATPAIDAPTSDSKPIKEAAVDARPPHLRQSMDPTVQCHTCSMFDSVNSRCTAYKLATGENYPVDDEMVCDVYQHRMKEADTPREDSGKFRKDSRVFDPLLLHADPLHAAEAARQLGETGRVRVLGHDPAAKDAADIVAAKVAGNPEQSQLTIQGNPYTQLKVVESAFMGMIPSERRRMREDQARDPNEEFAGGSGDKPNVSAGSAPGGGFTKDELIKNYVTMHGQQPSAAQIAKLSK